LEKRKEQRKNSEKPYRSGGLKQEYSQLGPFANFTK
jgi:hypothetical protein